MSSWNPDRLPQSLSYYNTNVFGMSGASRTPVVSIVGQVHFGKVNVVVRCVFKCERGRGRGGGMYRPPRPTDNGRSRRRPLPPPPTGSYPSHPPFLANTT